MILNNIYIKAGGREKMNQYHDGVIFDQWAYMTMLGWLGGLFIDMRRGIQILMAG
jgi:hypothetical protein